MRRALELAALAAADGEVPVGALVVDQAQNVLAEARNTREHTRDPCGHAELIAIRAAAAALGDWRLQGTTLYVTLEPCAMCAGAIVLARIPRVVYAAADPKGGFCGTVGDLSKHPRLNHHFDVVAGLLGDEAAAQLSAFFQALRQARRDR
ncbi:MAG: nucleoside deaminase [Myxococcales bacterium]|nr:nucleoside deaminase [Myxococcales bacterium]